MATMPTRRAVLVGLGGATAAGAGVGWALSVGPPHQGLKVLTAEEFAVVDAISAVIFPGVHLPLTGPEAEVALRVDELVAEMLDPLHANAFRYVLRALQWGTLASRGSRFTELDSAGQLEVLQTWIEPDVIARRLAAESLRAVLGMAYFAHPAIRDALGWRVGCRGAA